MTAFGEMLREFRQTRRLSQLDLALESDVSARHISFIETGRSQPSREMITRLATVLGASFRETNILLEAAGFSQIYKASQWQDETLAPVKHALHHMLECHEPYPAVVLDGQYNVLMSNTAHQRMLNLLQMLGVNLREPENIMELLFRPDGVYPFIVNWREVATDMLLRLHREALTDTSGAKKELLEKLLSYATAPANWRHGQKDTQSHPIVSLTLNINGMQLNAFSTIASFGTAIDVTVQDIRIEHYFPVDEFTKQFFKSMK